MSLVPIEIRNLFQKEIEGLAIQYLKTGLKASFEENPDLDYQIITFGYSYGRIPQLLFRTDSTKTLVNSPEDLIQILAKEKVPAKNLYDSEWSEAGHFYSQIFYAIDKLAKKAKVKKLGINNTKNQYSEYRIVFDRNLSCFIFAKDKRELVEIKGF